MLTIAPLLLGGQHAARALLRPVEQSVEIDREHAAPFLRRHLDGAAGRHGDAGVVDQDGDGAEGLFGLVEGARHGGAVGDVGLDGQSFAALGFDVFFERGKALGAAGDQRDGGAVVGERKRELHAQAAGGAGHQRDAALEIEHVCCFHGPLYTHEAAPYGIAGCARVACGRNGTIDSGVA